LGAGTVGVNVAKIAIGMDARVTLLDINLQGLRYMDDIFGTRITTLYANYQTIEASVTELIY